MSDWLLFLNERGNVFQFFFACFNGFTQYLWKITFSNDFQIDFKCYAIVCWWIEDNCYISMLFLCDFVGNRIFASHQVSWPSWSSEQPRNWILASKDHFLLHSGHCSLVRAFLTPRFVWKSGFGTEWYIRSKF